MLLLALATGHPTYSIDEFLPPGNTRTRRSPSPRAGLMSRQSLRVSAGAFRDIEAPVRRPVPIASAR